MKKDTQITARIFNLMHELEKVNGRYHRNKKALQIELNALKWVLDEKLTSMELTYIIMQITSKSFGLPENNVFESLTSRKKKDTYPRYFAMKLIIDNTRVNIQQLSRLFKKNRHTVEYNLKTINNLLDVYKDLRAKYESVETQVVEFKKSIT